MKNSLVLGILALSAWFAWQKYGVDKAPLVIEDPVYGEMRATTTIEGREIELAMFARMADEYDCKERARVFWQATLEDCPHCKFQPSSCKDELPPRYARLFDDVPIPSTYLSLTAGHVDERDGRIVVYGLTDKEGAVICEMMRTMILKHYQGEAHCVAASE